MDANTKAIYDIKLNKTKEALEKNHFFCRVAATKADALAAVKALLKEGDVVAVGGSMTLFETGVIDLLRNGSYTFLDRYASGLTREQVSAIHVQAFGADVYLTGTNAVTENGELVNVDGAGNRVAAMLYGPKSVIVVAGINKLVPDVDAAYARIRQIAAPANCLRLGMKTPCAVLGHCADCGSPDRICADYVTMGRQRTDGRVKVILVAEELGY